MRRRLRRPAETILFSQTLGCVVVLTVTGVAPVTLTISPITAIYSAALSRDLSPPLSPEIQRFGGLADAKVSPFFDCAAVCMQGAGANSSEKPLPMGMRASASCRRVSNSINACPAPGQFV